MDDSGNFRWKSSDPTSATDGTVVGTQTFSGTHMYFLGDKDLELGEAVKLMDRKLYRTTSKADPTCCGIFAGISESLITSFDERVPYTPEITEQKLVPEMREGKALKHEGKAVMKVEHEIKQRFKMEIADQCGAVLSLGDSRHLQNNNQAIGALVDGKVKAGDLLCSSSVRGRLTKQDDDLIHSYTVAKAMEDGDKHSPVYCSREALICTADSE